MHENSPYVNENARQDSAAARGFFRIGEVSRLTDTKPFVLRYWETEFPMLQPVKSPKGHRLYRHEDVETVRHIKHLLYDEGFTIAGARRHLSEGSAAAAAQGHAAQGHAAQTEDNFGGSAASPDARPDRDFRRPQVEGAPAPLPPESELPGTQELSGARLPAQSSTIDRPAPDRAAGNHPVADATIGNRAVVSDRAAPDRAAVDHAAPNRAAGNHPVADATIGNRAGISERAVVDHAAVGRAIVDRKVLLDLRDALRSLLTLLETE